MTRCKRISVQEIDRAERIRGRLIRDVSGTGDSSGGPILRMERSGDVMEIELDLDPRMSTCEVRELLHSVANVISDAIVNDCEPDLIEDILDRKYDFLNGSEREQVLEAVAGEMAPGDDMTRRKIRRKGFILRRLYDYLRENDRLSLEGFVAFRLKEYIESLNYRVEEAVSDVLIFREYTEWTELLQYLALPRLDSPERIHVSVQPDGEWTLWDDEQREVDVDLPQDFPAWEPRRETDYPDALVAALIIARPREVVVHDPAGSGSSLGAIFALREIFAERMRVCDGCQVCRPQ